MYERQTFGQRLPTLHEFVPAIAKAIDQQFGGRQRLVENKRITYFHKDRLLNKALEDASWKLNPVGMKTFYDAIILHEKRRKYMSVEKNGDIQERYESVEKTYQTDGQECSCSSFKQYLFCRHIIFYRMQSNLPIFDDESFHPALMKQTARKECDKNNPDAEDSLTDDLSPPSPGLEMVINDEKQKRKKPNHAKKYNDAFDVCKEMTDVLSAYDEQNFDIYIQSTKNFVKLLRSGLKDNLILYLDNPDMYEICPKSAVSLSQSTDKEGITPTTNLPPPSTASPPPPPQDQDEQLQSSELEEQQYQNVEAESTLNPPPPQPRTNLDSPALPPNRVLPHGFRELPDQHKTYFTADSIVKNIKGTGGCGYGAVAYRIYSDEDLFIQFRIASQKFLLRAFDMMNVAPFLCFPMEVIVKETDGFVSKYLHSIEEYKVFLSTEESLTSFSESNIELHNISNMLNIDIHCFSYGEGGDYWSTYTPNVDIVGFSEWAYPTNLQENTIVLYHEKGGSHFEVIVPRSQALPKEPNNDNQTQHDETDLLDSTTRKRRRPEEKESSNKAKKLSSIFESVEPDVSSEVSDMFRSSTLADGKNIHNSPEDFLDKSFDQILINSNPESEDSMKSDESVRKQPASIPPMVFEPIIIKRGRPKHSREGRKGTKKNTTKGKAKQPNFIEEVESVFPKKQNMNLDAKRKYHRGPYKQNSTTSGNDSMSNCSGRGRYKRGPYKTSMKSNLDYRKPYES